jgi:CheY-like chemotaxis protein/tRNA A-37 threonylcarbamoyl transferase component Bud32
MHIPEIVEQGQTDILIPLRLQNLDKIPIYLISTRLYYRCQLEDIQGEYKVISSTSTSELIPPNSEKEIILHVDIATDIPIGQAAITPILLVSWNDNVPQELELVSEEPYIWTVQPRGRTFVISTEHSDREIAGIPFWVKLEAWCNNQPDIDYSGVSRIYFDIVDSSNQTAAQIPNYLDLSFDHGKTITERNFCFYNTVETYLLRAKDTQAGGPQGTSNMIAIKPGELGSFRLELDTPQKNNTVLEGRCHLIALDMYENIKTNYHTDTILASSEGKIKGIPSVGNVISGANFQDGIADLVSLGIKINVPELTEGGKVVKLIAKANGKIGYSNEITLIPSTVMPPSATQALLRKLWGYRKKRIWIANTDEEVTNDLQENFQNDYDVLVRTLELDHLDVLIGNPPDVLFLDASTTESEGYAILREIRRTPNMEGINIFIIGSSTESERKISEVLRSGSIYLTKPISIPTLRAMVADLLETTSMEHGHMPTRGARMQGSEGHIYQIISKVGEGGMGYIYEAKRLRDQKKVIIKYLPPRDFKSIKSVVRFIQEAHTVLSFQHENLVTGYDMIMDRNRCFYVMEFIDGKTVEELIRKDKKIPPIIALRIVLQVATALQSLEEDHHLVHRDIKPSNILVTPHGLVKLVDFGIAKLSNHHLTTVGIILGTPYYLSPEQILGKEITIQSDIYSLGATFYHMITGEHPFQGSDVYNIIHQRLNKDPKDPRTYTKDIPEVISNLILRMMDRKPNRRFDNCRSLIVEIETILQYFNY